MQDAHRTPSSSVEASSINEALVLSGLLKFNQIALYSSQIALLKSQIV